MKKIVKIIGYTILGLLLVIAALLAFFVSRYNNVNKSISEVNSRLATTDASFFKFEFEEVPEGEWTVLPKPKEVMPKSGEFMWPVKWNVVADLPEAATWIDRLLGGKDVIGTSKTTIRFTKDEQLTAEGYQLDIQRNGIDIR